ncbi:MAG: ribosome-associated translation inhibitor RaiA [Alphaproteobacteria bacterium]|nr:ribosome-associated translation inhibitor RaiA [Alphaproteobacteria bacterium]
MEIAITGKQIDIGSSLRSYVEEHIEAAVKKFFENPLSASISFSKVGGGLIRSDISVHPISGVSIQGSAETGDAYASFDGACERISKQMQRYKKRLTNHKFDTEPVNVAVIEPEVAEDSLPSEEAAPVVIAEMQTELPLCTVSGAVMRMDLADVPALMFRNIAHGGLNMVYRRSDGNIGWIDPQQ